MNDLIEFIPSLAEGTLITLRILFFAAVIAVFFSFAAGLCRLSKNKIINTGAVIYIEFFRGTSALVQLFWIYFVLPFFGLKFSAEPAAVIALGLNAGAYGGEIVRGAVLAVSGEQRETAQALSFTKYQTLRIVILPQALRMMLPPFGNLLIELLKATSLVSLITVSDLTYRGKILIETTLKTAKILGLVLIIYYLISRLLNAVMVRLENRFGMFIDSGKTG